MTRRVARPEFVPPLWKASEERPGGVISFLINGPAILANANLRFAYGRSDRARSKNNGQPPSLRRLLKGLSPAAMRNPVRRCPKVSGHSRGLTCSLVQDERVVVGQLMISYLPKVSCPPSGRRYRKRRNYPLMRRGAMMSSARDGWARSDNLVI